VAAAGAAAAGGERAGDARSDAPGAGVNEPSFRIAVASGKGGTGKTTLAVALALVLPDAQLVDCDVETPNAHLFLDVEIEERAEVAVTVPTVRADRCDLCAGRETAVCREVCAFGALAVLPERVMVLEGLCHGCGACRELCPRRAIDEKPRTVGTVETGCAEGHPFVRGILNVGEPRPVDVLRAVRRRIRPRGTSVLDLAPGVSCPAVEALRGADVAVLVTEPTPFGLHDLILAAELCRKLDVPAGVVLNRSDLGDGRVEDHCAAHALPVLLRVPYDRAIAEAGARGVPLPRARPDLVEPLRHLVRDLAEIAGEGGAAA
jgi:MinD superfamily P-loop ATPase